MQPIGKSSTRCNAASRSSTMSSPVMHSVTGCSTWILVFISRVSLAFCSTTNSTVPAPHENRFRCLDRMSTKCQSLLHLLLNKAGLGASSIAWVPPLNGALALPQVDAMVAGRHHLDFNVACHGKGTFRAPSAHPRRRTEPTAGLHAEQA